MSNIFNTFKKEIRSIFRDKKTIITMLLFPLIIPAMIVFYGGVYDEMDSEKTTYTIGVDYSIDDVNKELLSSLNLEYKVYDNNEEIESAYEDNVIDGYVTYNEEEKVYKIHTDNSTSGGMSLNAYIHEYLEQYSGHLTNTYLVSQGIDLDAAYNHFTVEEVELGNNNFMLQVILTICFTYIIMAICMATSNMAISTTASEKENGTLETILTFPIKKNELIIGKYLSSVTVGFIASLIGLILMIVSLMVAKNHYSIFENYELVLSLKSILGSLVVILSASLFIAGAALALTCFSKSFKEAQSSVQMINMFCVIPMFISLMEIELTATYYLIPICNFEQVLMDLFTNNISLMNVSIVLISSVAYISIVLGYIIKAYNSEKILFSN